MMGGRNDDGPIGGEHGADAESALGTVGWFLDGGVPTDLTLVIALLAGASGAAAGLLAVFAARANADPQVRWIGMALGGYGILVIPASATTVLDRAPAVVAVHLVADGVVLGLLLIASLAAPPLSRRRFRVVLLAAIGVVVGAVAWGTEYPATVEVVATTVPVPVGLGLVWMASGVVIAVRASRRRAAGLRLLGVGVALFGVARIADTTVFDWRPADAAPHALGLAAAALVLGGALGLSRQALAQSDHRNDSLEEELTLAETRLAQTAERDHELRNGLAGLAGATSLLGGGCPDAGRLSTVVASELGRLDDLLRAPMGGSCTAPSASYAVAPVLQGLATLRRSAGMDLSLELEAGLRALGSPRTLAQVVTNIFANAERHAPGSPVRVTAAGGDDRVTVRVRDFGPATDAGAPAGVPGGLGLQVCRRLLAAEGGSIALCAPGRQEPGCLVVVQLPAAPAVVPRPFTPARAQSVS
jgi:two-component system OmpR family sensor kinase